MASQKVSTTQLRAMSKTELTAELDKLKQELQQLRIAQVTGGVQSKLAKIKTVRKGIARILTISTDNTKRAVAASYVGKKYIPKDLRPKLTRAKRRALTPKEKNKKNLSQFRKELVRMKCIYVYKP